MKLPDGFVVQECAWPWTVVKLRNKVYSIHAGWERYIGFYATEEDAEKALETIEDLIAWARSKGMIVKRFSKVCES